MSEIIEGVSAIEALLEERKVNLRIPGAPEDGWVDIIKDFLDGMDALGPWDHEHGIAQIKEKFGGLRIYLAESTAEREALVRLAEIRADKTCEWCGKPGTIDSSGYWLKTLCEPCKEKRKTLSGKAP